MAKTVDITIRATELDEYVEMAVRVQKLEAENARLQSALAAACDPVRMTEQLKICGEPFDDIKLIYETLGEWRKIGGRPSWLEYVRKEQRVRDVVLEYIQFFRNADFGATAIHIERRLQEAERGE